MLDDSYGNKRIAVAEALCRMGITEKPIQILGEEMNNDTRWVSLHAVSVLKSLGNIAKPVEKEIMGNINNRVERSHHFNRAYIDLLNDQKIKHIYRQALFYG